jgi:hypothetical protein
MEHPYHWYWSITVINNPSYTPEQILMVRTWVSLLLSTITLISLFVDLAFPQKYIIAIVVIVFLGLNWYRYENQVDFDVFAKKWDKQEKQDRIYKGYLIATYTALVFLFPIVVGYLRHNLGVID